MGNCCCRSTITEKETDNIIKEEETIYQLKKEFDPNRFNELFNTRLKRDPDQVMMGYFRDTPKQKYISLISLFNSPTPKSPTKISF